jgi:hypothetical protein
MGLIQKKIILPSLYNKLNLIKDIVKSVHQNCSGFLYMKEKFPRITKAKIKEGILVGPQTR